MLQLEPYWLVSEIDCTITPRSWSLSTRDTGTSTLSGLFAIWAESRRSNYLSNFEPSRKHRLCIYLMVFHPQRNTAGSSLFFRLWTASSKRLFNSPPWDFPPTVFLLRFLSLWLLDSVFIIFIVTFWLKNRIKYEISLRFYFLITHRVCK